MMRPSRWLMLLTLALSACGSAPDETSCSVQVYLDQDGDGFGDPEALLESCQAEVPGYVSNNADCDDSSALVSPDAVELCDEVDNNCDGETDEGFQINTWYPDLDEDGFGDDSSGVSTCSAPPNLILQGGDCDDLDPEVNPDRPEVCDGIDNDCDNNIDDADPDLIAASTLPFWPDTDADGYGDFAASAVNACEAPAGHIDNREDCDDTLPAVNPGGVEVCDGLDSDENCNGLVDDADPTVDPASLGSYWLDADGDGWGDPNVLASACDSPAGHVPNDLDCDDSSALLGDSADWWLDQDADGYGAGLPISACSAPGPDYVLHPLADCDDGDPATNPGAFDLCGDGVDSDCSGLDAGCAQPIVGVYDLDTPDWEYAATSGNEQTGFDIGVVDLNLDGARDLLVGSPAASTARVLFGPLDGTEDLASADVTFTGTAGSMLGFSHDLGDLTGDGVPDLVLGAPGAAAGVGRVWLVPAPLAASGDVGTLSLTQFLGDATHSSAGLDVAITDVSGDDASDLLIAGTGWITIHHGPTAVGSQPLNAPDAEVRLAGLGGRVEAGADTDGDGIADLVTSTVGTAEMQVFRGPFTGTLTEYEVAMGVIGVAGTDFGADFAVADFDDDGLPDIAASAPGVNLGVGNEGQVLLIHADYDGNLATGAAWATLDGSTPDMAFGRSVRAADIDHDGAMDLIVGSSGLAVENSAYVFYGPFTSSTETAQADAIVTGKSADLLLGTVGQTGDVDGDGTTDLVVGVPGRDTLDGGVSILLGFP